jgi:hypothetical protein
MTPLERKIIRRAAETVAATDTTCITAIADASGKALGAYIKLRDSFRSFYDACGCPFADWQGDPEELRTIRVLLLETFLIFDGELG